MQPLRIAIVGAGAIAQRNAAEAAGSGAATVAGVFDINTKVARDMAKKLGTNVFGSYEEVLGSRNAIAESDQGRSFHAFYDFLLSQQRQAEFTGLLEQVQALPAIDAGDPRMRRIHYDWLDAGERTQATVRTLSERSLARS